MENNNVVDSIYWANKIGKLILEQKNYNPGSVEYKRIDDEIMQAKNSMEICISEERENEEKEGKRL